MPGASVVAVHDLSSYSIIFHRLIGCSCQDRSTRYDEPSTVRSTSVLKMGLETAMEEQTHEYVGTLYVLPESRCFELHTVVQGAAVTITGSVAQLVSSQLSRYAPGAIGTIDPRELSAHPRRVDIATLEIHERHRAPRKQHLLTRVHDVEEGAMASPA